MKNESKALFKKIVNQMISDCQLKTMDIEVGKFVKQLREMHCESQAEFGHYLGLHQTAISRVESGEQVLSPEQWVMLYRKYCR